MDRWYSLHLNVSMIFFLMPTGILHQCSGSVHGIPMTKSDGHLKTGTLAAKEKLLRDETADHAFWIYTNL
jgi:hypothetical protein